MYGWKQQKCKRNGNPHRVVITFTIHDRHAYFMLVRWQLILEILASYVCLTKYPIIWCFWCVHVNPAESSRWTHVILTHKLFCVIILTLPWIFNVMSESPPQNLYLSLLYCQNDVRNKWCCQSPLYGQMDPIRNVRVEWGSQDSLWQVHYQWCQSNNEIIWEDTHNLKGIYVKHYRT